MGGGGGSGTEQQLILSVKGKEERTRTAKKLEILAGEGARLSYL